MKFLSKKVMLLTGICLSLSACEDGDHAPSAGIVTTISEIGATANQVVVDGDYAYIVASGDNVIQRLKLSDRTLEKNYIDVGQNANPYAMTVAGDDIYIACSSNHTIVKVSKKDPKQITTILTQADGINGPSDILFKQGTVYVTNTEYDMETYVPEGSIFTMKIAGQEKYSYKTQYLNPTAMYDYHLKHYQGMITVFTGSYLFDADYNITGFDQSAVGMSANFGENLQYDAYLLKNVDVGKVAPLLGGKHFVVGTAASAEIHLITIDDTAETVQDRFAVSAMKLPGELSSFHPVAVSEERVVLANFNADVLYQLDATDPDVAAWLGGDDSAHDAAVQAVVSTKLALSSSAVDRRGPISMAWDASRNQLLVLNTLSETLDIVTIDN